MGRLKFLDGLRGWAAVFVVLYHVFVDVLPVDAGSAAFLKNLVIFNGPLAVLVFFLVSGFALSVRYLADGDLRRWTMMASGRYFRLAIPISVACLVVQLALVKGWIPVADHRLPQFRALLNFDPTWLHLFRFSLWDVFFDYRAEDTYIGPLWTMSIELIGSMLVFVAIVLLRPAPYRPLLLLILGAAIDLVPMPSNWPLLALFPIGAAMADGFNRGWFDLIPNRIALCLIVAGCMMAAVAPHSSLFLPGEIAAFAIILGCIAAPKVRTFLNGRLSEWLGKISFPLYLMHGPVIWVVGGPLVHNFGTTVGARIAFGLLTVVISFAAAFTTAWIENIAKIVSHFAGNRAVATFFPPALAPAPGPDR